MRLHPQVLQIGTDWGDSSHTKLYFLEGEKRAIIDTGVDSSPQRDIAPYLAYYGYKLSDIDIILNTHGHFDHVDGNLAIPQAEVWMHEQDVFLVQDPEKAFDGFHRRALRLKSEDLIAGARARFIAGFVKQKVARVLKDGEVIDLGKGIQLRVVHVPGHTMGSVGYLWEKEGLLFLGDSAMGQGSRPGIMPVLFHPIAYAGSLQKLLEMSMDTVVTAHYYQSLRGSANSVKKGPEIRIYFEDCREINNRIMESMATAILRQWGAPFPVVMAAAVDILTEKLHIRRDPINGLPAGAVRTLGAFYDDILANL